jgi:hypothetical protein
MLIAKKHLVWIGITLAVLASVYFSFDQFFQAPQSTAENSGVVTLSWLAPTENEDDSPFTDLSGYAIHYTNKEGRDPGTVYVNDPTVTSYTIKNLSPGTYYFSISAIEVDGDESALSNVIEKTVQ